jgi:chaperonin cofactor prefoldin
MRPPPLRCPRDGKFEQVSHTLPPNPTARKSVREIRQIDQEIRQINNINDVLDEIDDSLPMYLVANILSSWEQDKLKKSFEDKELPVLLVRETKVNIRDLAKAERRGWFGSR